MRAVRIERTEAHKPRAQVTAPAATAPKTDHLESLPNPSTAAGVHEKRECPNCTASVPETLARCRCGFEFASGDYLIPGLTMTDEERAAFAKIFTSP